jgi:potassium-transporting ATPase potassium-binding subunit
MWLVPCLIVGLAVVLAVPLGLFMARVLDHSTPSNAIERWVNTGNQNWKQYCLSLLLFNAVAFIIGFLLLAVQPWVPEALNPDGKKMLAPSTIFNTVSSFVTNTNLQHYSGEVHLSYFSQLFFICWNQFVTPGIGVAALLAMIRGLRGDGTLGNYYLDMWRSVVYIFLPLSLITAILLVAGGVPMTMDGAQTVKTLEGNEQIIARGPVAAIVAIKQLGTNGGGFFGANSAHPFENPNAWTNVIECVSILLFPMAIVVMFGKMVGNMKHAMVIGGVMMLFLVGLIAWTVWTDEMQPNRGLQSHAATEEEKKSIGELYQVPLPVEQSTGNLEGKELRFGPGASSAWVVITTCVANGSVNCAHDSLNPLAQLSPLTGMWLNCIFGGKGVGFINMLVYLIVGVFLSGLMVGRTPEYLGKKVEAREMKLAMLALLIHPIMILVPSGLFAVMDWGKDSAGNPGAHGLTEILYEFTTASANNGSETGGLANQNGFYVPPPGQPTSPAFVEPDKNPGPNAPNAVPWDIATGLVMMISRFIPIIAPIALAANLAKKKPTPMTVGTLRTDTFTFAFVLLGTILLVGALLFMPVAMLGPVADHFGPLPFGN